MNIFYEELPDYININGVPYKVITDFREWIRFSDMIASDVPADLKAEFLMEMFLEDAPQMYSKQDMDAVVDGIIQFLTMSELDFPVLEESKPDQNGQKKKAIYYEYDAPCIISAFWQDYGIDLLDIEYMHWWKFKMLLDGIAENRQIKERIYYRTVDVRQIKDRKEVSRIMRIRRRITIPEQELLSDEEIGNAFV